MAILNSSVKQLFNYKLLLLYLSICSLILLKTYFNIDGCATPDSGYYLNLAKNLSEGHGFKIADYTSSDGKSFFAIWPVGYPVLIFLVSKITGLGVLWASKVLNIILAGIILLIFQYIFKKNAHWAGLIFFVDSFILIFCFTWSEVPFVFFLLLFCISLYKCVETDGMILWLAGLLFSAIAVFLVRYIGLFSVSVIGLITLVNLFKRRWQLSVKLMIVALIQLVFAGFYLYHNKMATGFITGMPRNLPKESNLELLKQLFSALKEEFIVIHSGIPLSFSFGLLVLLGIYLFWSKGKSKSNEKDTNDDMWKYFLLTGILYYGAIVGAKWFSDFMALDYRYLFPGSFFLLLSLALYLQGKPIIKIMNSQILYLIVLASLTIHYIPYTYYIYKNINKEINYFQQPNYTDNTRAIMEKYKTVEPKSIVIFGPDQLRYLRDDIIPTDIYNRSSYDEMIKFFTQKQDWNVYMNIRNDLDTVLFHESFIRFMEANRDKQLVKVHQAD
jgi:hypothetical protein